MQQLAAMNHVVWCLFSVSTEWVNRVRSGTRRRSIEVNDRSADVYSLFLRSVSANYLESKQ